MNKPSLVFPPEELKFSLGCHLMITKAESPSHIEDYKQLLERALNSANIANLDIKTDNQKQLYQLCKTFNLFCQLIEAGLPLHLEEYQDLLEILLTPAHIANLNIKTDNPEQLYQLCQLLWVKSPAQKQIFQQVCQQISQTNITYIAQNTDIPEEIEETVLISETTTTPTDTTPPEQTPTPVILDRPKPPEPPSESLIPRLKKPSKHEPDKKPNRFRVTKDYQNYRPVSLLQMQKTCHQLNDRSLGNIATEIDLPATIYDISKNANLFNIHLQPPALPKTQLILLIDRLGSMVPFHSMEKQLQKTLNIGGRLNNITTYYFINSPIYLYTDPDCEKNINLWQILTNAHSEHTLLLIFSDAGAARGNSINPNRVQSTKEFYDQVSPYFRAIAWLNPMPKQRWQQTSAQAIAQFIQMFAGDRSHFAQAINYLQTHRQVCLKPPEIPKTQLILLIDRSVSMVPFHHMKGQLQKTLNIGNRLNNITTYYFINSPLYLYLYNDPDCEKKINLWQILTNAHSEHTLLLIFSDAGAARGNSINPNRVQSTKEFYNQVSPYFRAIAWLNPMPKQRWQKTSAQAISQFIPMFAGDRSHFDQAINYLQTHRQAH